MKKILIIGDDSYIGMSFEAFARDKLEIKMVSSRNGAWREVDFRGFDSVLHCAGIAHVKQKKKMQSLYYEINCDLAVDVAQKAKTDGAKKFVFLSTMAVYNTSASEINQDTLPNPNQKDFYGSSKFKAEQEIQKLACDNFKLCIIRPPMVYGEGCKGNFPKLVKLARKTPLFPNYPNKRSMIYIDNLCSFICGLIEDESDGIFLPQNGEYVNTTELVRAVRACYGKRLRTTKIFNPMIRFLSKRVSVFNKLFGNLSYIQSGNESGYNVIEFKDSIKKSIGDII
ncbi:MAG: NAD-dependent epimerase/dehydratase family protein [Oscillospiraceae bacterium]|nr:NAD-dependent epimerase/dehydratase family protein [Oscillospiraceae bacterium]